MDKVILNSGQYKINVISEGFYNWLEKFDGNPSDFDSDYLNSIPLNNTPKIPKYLTHCSYVRHIRLIIGDKKFGGRKVLSGNVELTPDLIHFAVIPFLWGHYDIGLVFNTQKLIERNPNKLLSPTLYLYNSPIKEEREKYCLYFDNDGWKKREKRNIDRDIFSKINSGFIHEREWNMEALINFELQDIEAIVHKLDNWTPFNIISTILINKDREITNPNEILEVYNKLNKNIYELHIKDKYKPFEFNLKKNDSVKEIYAIIFAEGKGYRVEDAFSKEDLEKPKSFYSGILRDEYSQIKDFFNEKGLIITANNVEKW